MSSQKFFDDDIESFDDRVLWKELQMLVKTLGLRKNYLSNVTILSLLGEHF